MNGQRRMRLGRWAALCGIAVGMSLSGITYASWSDTLQVSGDLSTGRFHMVLADTPQAYTLSLLDQAGTRLETLPGVQVTRSPERTSISSGVPRSGDCVNDTHCVHRSPFHNWTVAGSSRTRSLTVVGISPFCVRA